MVAENKQKISKQKVAQTWVFHGLKDFYISFEFEDANKWHEYSTFFCHQGLEKICKAYLLLTEALQYENLTEKQALDRVNKIAKGFGHELKKLLGLLCLKDVLSSVDISRKYEGFTGDELIKVLEKAYIESRYPVPDPIHRKYPIKSNSHLKLSYDPIRMTAPIKFSRKIAFKILEKIKSDFSIVIPENKVSNKIADKDWTRFCNIFFGNNNSGDIEKNNAI